MIRSHAGTRNIAVLVLLSLAAVACSGASSTPAGGGGPSSTSAASSVGGSATDPCALVTPADAATALGGSVPPSTSSPTGIYQSCAYATASGATLIVTTRSIDRAGFDTGVLQNPGAPPSPLAGVCQDAYTIGSAVWSWQNGTEVDAHILGTSGDSLAAAKQLITTACGRV